MRREGLDDDTLQAALREHGVADVKDVEMAVLEVDGSISVVPGGQETKRVRHPMKYMRRPRVKGLPRRSRSVGISDQVADPTPPYLSLGAKCCTPGRLHTAHIA